MKPDTCLPKPTLPRQRGLAALACCLAACTALGLPQPAQAQGKPGRSALIVGVSTYAAPEVPALPGVPFDIESARAVARAMDIPESRTTVLRDAQATKAGILDALEQLADTVTEGARVFVYFSGHGTRWYEPALQGCKEGLLAFDRQAITNDEIAQRTRRMSTLADKVVVMFDACHSDGVAGRPPRTRAIASGALTPKFFLKNGADASACSRPSNVASRGLLAASTRLGALRENFVQISSSRVDEVSFDEAGKGGIATQGVRDCLLGQAVDRDGSGAVSITELESCAQAFVERKLSTYTELKAHHITITGNRNIVPAPTGGPLPTLPSAPAVAAAVPVPALPTVAPAPPIVITHPATPALAEPAAASLATLRDIDAQRNPRRRVDVRLKHGTLKIGGAPLELTARASHDGYLYVVMLGSDRKSFYLVFPNALDRDNAIRAGVPFGLPRTGWTLLARGPAGTDHLLVLVSDTPRDLSALPVPAADSATPFSFTLNDLPGRRALVDFFTGRGVTGSSANFGARLLSIQEVH